METPELLTKLVDLKATMISVATGGPRIDDVNEHFGRLYDETETELKSRGIPHPVPFRDLWLWYGRWSSDLPTWASRRTFVTELFDPIIKAIKTGRAIVYEATGWTRVDRVVGSAREQLAKSSAEEEFQTVGLLCREILISLSQQVFVAHRHPILDGKAASPTDFKRMIDAYIATELAGGAMEEARKHARSALDLALRLQHQRTANFRDAAICMEATASVVNIIAIVEGRFDAPKANGT